MSSSSDAGSGRGLESHSFDQGGELPAGQTAPIIGRRERNRQRTRARIADAASKLFLEKGYALTTIDEIAELADVSKRTFHDYFPTKEDVVFAWQDEFSALLVQQVNARPKGEPLTKALWWSLAHALAAMSHGTATNVGQLIYDTPVLQARDFLKYRQLEQSLAEAIARRIGEDPRSPRVCIVAMVWIGTLRVGSEARYGENPAPSVEETARQYGKALMATLKTFGLVTAKEIEEVIGAAFGSVAWRNDAT